MRTKNYQAGGTELLIKRLALNMIHMGPVDVRTDNWQDMYPLKQLIVPSLALGTAENAQRFGLLWVIRFQTELKPDVRPTAALKNGSPRLRLRENLVGHATDLNLENAHGNGASFSIGHGDKRDILPALLVATDRD